MRDDLTQEIYRNMISMNVTNMILSFRKKIKDDLLPKKYNQK